MEESEEKKLSELWVPHLNCQKEYYGSKLFQLFILNINNIKILSWAHSYHELLHRLPSFSCTRSSLRILLYMYSLPIFHRCGNQEQKGKQEKLWQLSSDNTMNVEWRKNRAYYKC